MTSHASFRAALEYVFQLAKEKRLVLVINEGTCVCATYIKNLIS